LQNSLHKRAEFYKANPGYGFENGKTAWGAGLILLGTVTTGGTAWVVWGAGAALDGHSFYESDYDPMQLAPSLLSTPKTGIVGAVTAGGVMIYNEVKD
jgi:hypothetical protein